MKKNTREYEGHRYGTHGGHVQHVPVSRYEWSAAVFVSCQLCFWAVSQLGLLVIQMLN